jgi:hypothetical protein
MVCNVLSFLVPGGAQITQAIGEERYGKLNDCGKVNRFRIFMIIGCAIGGTIQAIIGIAYKSMALLSWTFYIGAALCFISIGISFHRISETFRPPED